MTDERAGPSVPQSGADERIPAMVGREDELDRLHGAFARASGGSPAVVVIVGEAGIGKSRLLGACRNRVGAAGGVTLVGGCLDLADGGLPLLPFAEAMRAFARNATDSELDRLLGTSRGRLAQLVPSLGPETSADEPLAATRLFEGILALLARLGETRPVLLAFEDVHWSDRATRDLVTFLARNLASEPVLLVLTCRTDDLTPAVSAWMAELSRQSRVERLSVERLPRAAVRAQLTELLGNEPSPAELDRTYRRSDGNPYFVEELAAADPDNVPATVAELLTTRLGRLTPATRDVVRVVALGGRSIDEELVAAVTERSPGEVRAALREAVEQRILGASGGDRRIGFRHALVREVAAAELLSGEQASLHERLAAILAQRPDLAEPSPAGAAAELAFHWEAAGRIPEALASAVEAAAGAARVAAWVDADRQYGRALRLLERANGLPADLTRGELLRRAAEAAELSGDLARAQQLIEAAIEATDAGVEPERAGLLHARRGYLRWAQGDTPAALGEYERAVTLVPAEPPSAARARVLASLANSLLGLGRYAEARETCRLAIRCAEESGAGSEEARARNVLGSSLVAQGNVEAGIAELEHSRDLATLHGPADMRVVGAYNLAVNLALSGRLVEAEEAARQGAEAARTEGLQRRYGMDLAALEGDVLTRLGRWDEASSVLDAGLALDPAGRGTVYLAAARGRLDALRGDTDAAEKWFAAADGLAAGSIDADLAGYLARARAELALSAGRAHDALGICRAAEAALEDTDDHFVRSPLLVLGVQAAAEVAEDARARQEAGAVDLARSGAEPMLAGIRGLASADSAGVVRALVGLADAEAGRLDGESDPSAWALAAAELAAIPDPHGVAYAQLRQAEAALRRDGVRADAGELLRAAARAATELGARPLMTVIDRMARRARIDLAEETTTAALTPTGSAPNPERRHGLSARELEVLRLVADGRTNGEIAEALFIARKTAGVHVTHILDKLGVSNRVEAAMAAARLGLLDEDRPQRS
jgi:DNA-binding CsgD family transcriptional regulator